jgi:hypothetical protein
MRNLVTGLPGACRGRRWVEPWFSILQSKRVGVAAFESLADLESKIAAFITDWNEVADPFDWTPRSFDKVLASAHDTISTPLAA